VINGEKKDKIQEEKAKCTYLTIDKKEAGFIFYKYIPSIISEELDELEILIYHMMIMQGGKAKNKRNIRREEIVMRIEKVLKNTRETSLKKLMKDYQREMQKLSKEMIIYTK
jgi:UDP-N-acetylglucosamine transferase subunit ALG13